ncbi:type II secretion system protein [Falsiroseomonas sp. CW058]|uniref:type II secretion system protein n=1 Tax=Falsiroseomonas sp. CW058 TaxID=3388664 RepID=UPI003D31EB8B
MSASSASRAPGFTLVECLAALAVLGVAIAVALPPMGDALRAFADRRSRIGAAALAQSVLDLHAAPGAARPGRWQGRAPDGTAWRVEVGEGEPGAPGLLLHPVRVLAGPVVLDTLRPGRAAPPP